MSELHISLSSFLRDLQRQHRIDPSLSTVIRHVASACIAVSEKINASALAGILGDSGQDNIQGEVQKKLDVIANDIFVEHGVACGQLSAMVSEEVDSVIPLPPDSRCGPYALLFDPLDGSSNIDLDMSVGSIFSILQVGDCSEAEIVKGILQPGTRQIAAGYAIYGPSTMLVLTTGKSVDGFTLDRQSGEFKLTHPDLRIPPDASEFAINMARAGLWEQPVSRYVEECVRGRTGPRGRPFNMRWLASMVAEVHRILMRGGVFMYPLDRELAANGGRLRLMYEANPMSLIVERAGGGAITGRECILELVPVDIHQRVPVILGSANEVDYLHKLYSQSR